MPRHVVILGAGISGLSKAWYLKKEYGSEVSITILEKSSRIGGWIQTINENGFLFEQGPRSCRTKGSGKYTLGLIEDLGLQNQVIVANSSAQSRYIYTNKKLQKLPSSFFELLSSPFVGELIKATWRDLWNKKTSSEHDESIYEFFSRKLSPELSELLIDPFVSGIYAGDMRKLSLEGCFPSLHRLKKENDSMILGMIKNRKKNNLSSSFVKKMQEHPMFSFRKGMQTLTNELGRQVDATIRLDCEVISLEVLEAGIRIKCRDQTLIDADEVFSTLPTYQISKLLYKYESLKNDLEKVDYSSVAVVNLGYKKAVLKEKGFGYLIPKQENENILGCVWDSCVFPEQNNLTDETRVTVMIGRESLNVNEQTHEKKFISIALEALKNQLGVNSAPDSCVLKIAHRAIPQYEIGYRNLKYQIEENLSGISPRIHLIGSAFSGVSVNDIIKAARLGVTL
ncbi:MAG: protoporphyrinogen oxidase [Parachlamydiaceae bacterium]|nr:protoporphyrinogen oxidase [Parachlamydiaceae bacterium]